MLHGEQTLMIRYLEGTGMSISGVARATGHDRKTVRAVLARSPGAGRRPGPRRARKLDAHEAWLVAQVAAGVTNASRLYRDLVGRGYEGKATTVRAWVQARRPAREPVATVRFETAPGDQAQVDWAHFGTVWHRGRERSLVAFVLVLGWSRAMHVEFATSTRFPDLARCHARAFEALGGVPRRVLYDNPRTVVAGREPGGAVRFTPALLDLAAHYGYVPQACRPYRAQTKGKVERAIQYLRRNFWPGMRQGTTFADLDDLNARVREWLATVANARVHATTGEVPAMRLPLERLRPLGGVAPYEAGRSVARRASRDGRVSYDGASYGVPPTLAGRLVLVREAGDGDVVIASPDGSWHVRHALADGVPARRIPGPAFASPVASPVASPPPRALPGRARGPAPWADRAEGLAEVDARALASYDLAEGVAW